MCDPAYRRRFIRLTALCTFAYFVSYLSRINLAAVMVEIVSTGFAGKETAALALSFNAIAYGAGQIISGWLGDRCRPQNVMLCGFVLAGAVNLGVGLCPGGGVLIPLWAVNGFAQALMWPPMVRILTHHLRSEEYTVACKWVSWSSALATMAVYALAPALIAWADFRAIFFIGGVAALVAAVVWKVAYERGFSGHEMAAAPEAKAHAAGHGFDRAAILLLPILLAIILHGALRDGVTNWMPTLVSESFQLDSSSAILGGVLLPVFHILCSQATAFVYRRFIRNEMLCSGVIFLVAVLAAAMLNLLGGSAIISMLLMAALVGCMHGVNFLFTCMVPPCFARYGHVSLISGVLNASTYLGAALSTYGIALFSQRFGWAGTIWLWAAIALFGAVIVLLIAWRWQRFTVEPSDPGRD
ncbi:MAG: MFS transporter [Clostridia bacterium]|nr:MFS transporter [Clostridia bacterium]